MYGDVLLYDGSVLSTSLREGTVLVCYNNTYGTVCDDRWDSIEASIVCGKLGFDGSGMSELHHPFLSMYYQELTSCPNKLLVSRILRSEICMLGYQYHTLRSSI